MHLCFEHFGEKLIELQQQHFSVKSDQCTQGDWVSLCFMEGCKRLNQNCLHPSMDVNDFHMFCILIYIFCILIIYVLQTYIYINFVDLSYMLYMFCRLIYIFCRLIIYVIYVLQTYHICYICFVDLLYICFVDLYIYMFCRLKYKVNIKIVIQSEYVYSNTK